MKTIFLDQLHWIELAKFINSKPTKPGTSDAYHKIQELRKTSTAIFPLTINNYFEILKQSDPARRERLSCIMRDLSDGYTIADQSVIVKSEIHNGLLAILNSPGTPVAIKYIGKGVSHILRDREQPEFNSLELATVPNSYKNFVFDLMEYLALTGHIEIGAKKFYFLKLHLITISSFVIFYCTLKVAPKIQVLLN